VTETKTDESDDVTVEGYNFVPKHRSQEFKRKSGGIGVYIRHDIAQYINAVHGESEYIMWLAIDKKLTTNTENSLLGITYLPPENSRFLNEDDLRTFENEITSMANTYKYIWLAGDFNARTSKIPDFIPSDPFIDEMFDVDLDLQTHFNKHTILENLSYTLNRASKDNKTNTHGMRLIELCRNNNLFILNGRSGSDNTVGNFTFRDRSVIDYVISSAENFESLQTFDIVETDPLYSDGHNALEWKIYTKHMPDTNIDNNEQPNRQDRPIWDNNKAHAFCQNMNTNNIKLIDALLTGSNITPTKINQATAKLQEVFISSANSTFNLNKTKLIYKSRHNNPSKNKPWFGSKCNKARQNYHRAKNTYKIDKTDNNKINLKNASKEYKRTMNYYINDHRYKQSEKLRSMNTKNPKQYWKFLKSLDTKKPETKKPTLEDLHKHFENINKYESDEEFDTENFENNAEQELNGKFTEQEIHKCITNLKNGKASSPSDKIINEYIKSTENAMMQIYVKLFNAILDTGHIPHTWLEGYIIPIYKNKGDPQDPVNYRPITIISCLGKLFTSVINQRLTEFLDKNNIPGENQAGFRKQYSCTDHIFTLHSLIEILKKKKKKLYCAFIDFSQAFDKVWRFGLWNKLSNIIGGKIFKTIFNLYQNIKSCVQFSGEFSNFFNSEIGVRQGDNLSPLLFSIFLNDLQEHLDAENIKGIELKDQLDESLWLKLLLLLYADDTIILSDDAKDFQKALDSFNKYCNTWKLKVNTSKTKVIIFGARNRNRYNFTLGESALQLTDTYHYLGITFSNNGSFLNARKHIVAQAKKAMFLLFAKSNKADLPPDLVLKLFDYTVSPILTYGSEVIGFENTEMFETVHNDFLRKLSNAKKSTPIYMLHGEFGRHPIHILIKTRMISYWNRLVTGKEQKIALTIYKYMINQQIECKWINKIKTILNSTGKTDVWINQPFLNTPIFHKQVKQTLLDQNTQTWRAQLDNSSKGRYYKLFKPNPEFEQYLKTLKKCEYIPLFKFRTTNHRLPIETGRYDGTTLENRTCTLCNQDSIGSEQHYLLGCPFFNTHRQRFLSTATIPNTEFHFKSTMTTNSTYELENLSKFVKLILNTF